MPNADIQTATHVCLQKCMHTFIQCKHFILELYVTLELSVATILDVLVYSISRISMLLDIWKFWKYVNYHISQWQLPFTVFCIIAILFYTSILYNSPLVTAKILSQVSTGLTNQFFDKWQEMEKWTLLGYCKILVSYNIVPIQYQDFCVKWCM